MIDYDRIDPNIATPENVKQPSPDPVHEFDGAWWFWDETWADRVGPYPSREKAHEECKRYAAYLDGLVDRPEERIK